VRHGGKWRHKEGLEGVVEASGYIMEGMEGVNEMGNMKMSRRECKKKGGLGMERVVVRSRIFGN
jgi:hypothetical protein